LAFYRCAGPAATPLRELIRLAGARWAIEECFQTAKNESGLELETAATEIDEVTHQPAHFRM